VKLATNIYHVILYCWKGFHVQRSKVTVIFNNRLRIVPLYIIYVFARGRHQLCTNVWIL